MSRKLRTIKVKASEILWRIERARRFFSDWQAECVEVLFHPQVYRRWRLVNRDRYPEITVRRHRGRPHKSHTPEMNRAIGEDNGWLAFAGYYIPYTETGRIGWNFPKADWYAHSPSCTWNGLRRETVCSFAYNLRMYVLALQEGRAPSRLYLDNLRKFGIEVVNDLGVASRSAASIGGRIQ